MTKTEELQAIHDGRKSFYKKAHVITDNNNNKYLKSYDTIVAAIKNDIPEVYGTYSMTTRRHINEFLRQYGHDSKSKNELMEAYPATHKTTIK